MANRISSLLILRSILTSGLHRWCVELEAPIRSLRLNVRKTDLFYDAKPSFIFGDKDIGKALLKGHFQNSEQNLDVGAQGDPGHSLFPLSSLHVGCIVFIGLMTWQ